MVCLLLCMIKKQDMKVIAAKMKAVNDLIALGVMSPFVETPVVYVFPQALKVDDRKYMTHWCQNILRVWALHYPQNIVGAVADLELVVYNKENGDLICRYSDRKDIVFG